MTPPGLLATFWLVWSPTGVLPPRMKHATYQAAEAEAQRLALRNPGQSFFVLRMESRSVLPTVLTTHSEAHDSEIPF